MRILAIRGKNLASLAEPFEILLTEGALQTAGLFAITGQTGAGKSTILDALCLALYDKMPRLPDGQGVAIGQAHEEDSQRVKSNDVRSILRRGSHHAYAEVDFIGKDKQSYRARWELRKARTSTLQKQDMLLTQLSTGQRIGQTKTQTLEAICERIDLSFEQFRRSVLLAQGDFAAFLKAKKDERSSLLERITGTELYSELSKAAFERAKFEKERLQRLDDQLKHLVALSSEERERLETQLTQLSSQLGETEQQLSDIQSIIDWHKELKKRQLAQNLASEAFAQCHQSYIDNAPNRTLLAQVQAAQPLRILLNHYQNATNDYQAAQQQLNQSCEASKLSSNQLDAAQTALNEQQQALQAAQDQQQRAAPVIKQVRELDTQLQLLTTRLNALQLEQQSLQQSLSQSQQSHDALITSQISHKQSLQQLTTELAGYSDYQAIALEWPRWDSELDRYQQLKLSDTAEQYQTRQTLLVVQQSQQDLQQLKEKLATSQAVQQQQQSQLQSLQNEARQLSLSDLHQQKENLERKRERSQLTLSLAQQIINTQQLLEQHSTSLETATAQTERASEQLQSLQQAQLLNSVALEEAKKALALFDASSHKNALQFRALLLNEQPCPVCGSVEHPWQHSDNIDNTQSKQQSQRVEQLAQTQLDLIKQLADTEKNHSHAQQQTLELQGAISAAQALLLQLQHSWAELESTLEFTAINAASLQQCQQTSEQLNVHWQQLKQQEKTALTQQALIDAQQHALAVTTQHHAQLSDEYTKLSQVHTENQATLARCQDKLANYQWQLAQSEQSLSVPLQALSNWRDYLNDYRPLKTIVATIEQLKQQQSQSSSAIAEADNQLLLLAQQLRITQEQHSQKQSELARLLSEQQTLLNQRTALLAIDISADNYELEHQQQLHIAQQSQQQALALLNEISTTLATQKSQQQHWQQESHRRYQLLNQAHQALNEALAQQGLDFEQVHNLLHYDSDWLNAEAERLANLERAVQQATALLSVKSQDTAQHQSQPARLSEAEAIVQLGALQQQLQQLNAKQQECALQLREDDRKQQSSNNLQHELSAQQNRWGLWQSLNELIGSSSGSKFRVFAQSLTLEALLAHSNAHLKDFAPRYVLQRVPRSDLELQIIDRDMANDVRSVHSLSGGESFLVSLALALGLASLASNKTQVESLFIDEGFGSLDPETLDIAIASLDTLQSLGRKIGIISHVPILVERIGAKVMVEKQGGGKSRVIISNGW